ncbi:MAG: glutamine-hydrolyzing GMP synthase [Spirochaetes bacterium]|jgi:GMP synthase (glutamine-hydrolysing)|nr:glutamine-hydrolyzing GMP synthase [Spirochaetota bacterium]
MIAILDFGSQYSQLIARRIRECNVYCELLSHDLTAAQISEMNPEGIILSGGPSSVYQDDAPSVDPAILEMGVPILGICYGMQLMVHLMGGKVELENEKREYGTSTLTCDTDSPLFVHLPEELTAWMSHGDSCATLPKEFLPIAETTSLPHAAIMHKTRPLYGVQFHPEVSHTDFGMDIIKNFVFNICEADPKWTMSKYIENEIEEIRTLVGNDNVLLGLSGGVDSTTVAALMHRAIGPQLTCMFIDQGFMRKDEAKQIVTEIAKYLKIKLVHIDASAIFYERLKGISDPEEKRKIIGNEFISTFERESKKLGGFKFLAQGTLYPDVIESAVAGGTQAKTAVTIKTHHNVGGLPEKMNFKLIEPLRFLFKDEVRKLAQELGVHNDLVFRHPFPGPGLAIRILGEITEDKVKTLQLADHILIEELRRSGWYDKSWQALAVLLPVKTVGVMGDMRTYAFTCAIRVVSSDDAMTAIWTRLPYELLDRISTRIVNEVHDINRVVYDITSKPPGTIEWE